MHPDVYLTLHQQRELARELEFCALADPPGMSARVGEGVDRSSGPDTPPRTD